MDGGRLNRREFLAAGAAALAAAGLPRRRAGAADAWARPTAAQLAWQRDERALFIHFGINTFTGREWGDGTESPALFNPPALDTRQWARAARMAGFQALILTAKHHDGFCLWPSRVTRHSVAASRWRGGRGDVVRAFTDACRAEGMGAGVYLSPWDRHEPTYGDSPRYNDFYCAQLTELLTGYGPLQEIWFDGAHGGGANGSKQVYDWVRIWALAKRLQPQALLFSDAGPDLRWIGNERGMAGDPDWCAVDPSVVAYPGQSGPAVAAMLQHGDALGTVWRPGEADVSIRPGWFYHAAEDSQVKSVAELADLYFNSVGRNAKLLLNVPPTPAGLLHHTDVNRLADFDSRLRFLFSQELSVTPELEWRGPVGEMNLGQASWAAIFALEEGVTQGQRVGGYTIEGDAGQGMWTTLSQGSTIGVRKLDRLAAPVRVRRLRLRARSADGTLGPRPVWLRAYGWVE